MKWIRRIHLYSGLFMLPWVLLYGFTALLFNHPTTFPDSDTTIHPFAISDPNMLPTAAQVAERVVAQLKEDQADQDTPVHYQLDDPASAEFTGKAIGSARSNDGQQVTVVMNLAQAEGYVRVRASKPQASSTGDVPPKAGLEESQPLSIETGPLHQQIQTSISSTLKRFDLEDDQLTFRGVPGVEFDLRADDQVYRVRFAPDRRRRTERTRTSSSGAGKDPPPNQSGKLTVVGQGGQGVTWRRFLLRLHMAHGYPVQQNARWFWAISVDAMFVSMMFWGLSGVFMWWQIKKTRRLGGIILIMSTIAATWLVIGMHGLMSGS